VDEDHGGAFEHASDATLVGPELVDDRAVEVLELRHGPRLPTLLLVELFIDREDGPPDAEMLHKVVVAVMHGIVLAGRDDAFDADAVSAF
jgi:hypothetical protein